MIGRTEIIATNWKNHNRDQKLFCTHCGEVFANFDLIYIFQNPISINDIELRHHECLEENLK